MGSLRHSFKDVTGARLSVIEAGEIGAPIVMLVHGFPESAFSWRHQMQPLADAGYHVIAPNNRGYADSSAPKDDISYYGIQHLTNDLIELAEQYGQQQVIYVGHDWGSFIVWELGRLRPERAKAIVGVSVPYTQWPITPTELFKQRFGDRFFYMLYFQRPRDAEEELERDVRDSMKRILWMASGDGARAPSDPLPPMVGTGYLTQNEEPPALPWSWLTEDDLNVYVSQFEQSGFFGPISFYRNLDANYELLKNLTGERLTMPCFFIGGERDLVIANNPTAVASMQKKVANLKGSFIIPKVGHWIQQEDPATFNETLLSFLSQV
jgi:pimeloyl-ACP methyl ester carboxylesterase